MEQSEYMCLTVKDDNTLVVAIPEGRLGEVVREFRVPLQQAAHQRDIRGGGFLFLIRECRGLKYEGNENVKVTWLEGYLFYN